jgi:hypothetical protein
MPLEATPTELVTTKPKLSSLALRREKALCILSLPEHPRSNIDAILTDASLSFAEAIDYLRNSSREEAKRILDVVDRLEEDDLAELPIDYLFAAASVDGQVAIELLCGAVYAQRGNIATLVNALAHSDLMRKSIEFAKEPENFNDRRLMLQIAGSAPVPKTAITNLTVRGNVNTQINNQVPRLEDVTRNVDAVLEGL